ncbi:PadR family transcriptional regulator [Streptomyces sp. LBUM 1486]|uniref:PadR family transcriptional regulator n=1 Tax=Streptomyces scabiei TaxID=1930 RepID=UPI001B31D202|nr:MULTISPECIES: PadR family transcriptional regulator [Streptomyces]MBP5918707.1 PadR family transcriptional regulator [Streptomyces sp. LBUM 1486]MDX2800166.1 PadR family transcriptional regulator [Streptomyces scabiei]MDX3125843.1 PadR family transcriptional regulator [Streptomyces scabiei]MDX3283654.1 PadR family transcriptional regulator [Streptomyces scabiei]
MKLPGRVPRRIRRILMAFHLARRPLTAADLIRATCHGPGTVYPALVRLERAGWIERLGGPLGMARYDLTAHGRTAAGLTPREQAQRPTHPNGTPYRYHEIVAEGWGYCDGCRMWSTANPEQPHQCAKAMPATT